MIQYHFLVSAGALFINGDLGILVLEYLIKSLKLQDVIVVLNSNCTEEYKNRITDILNSNPIESRIWITTKTFWKDDAFLNKFRKCNFAVSALYNHKIPNEIIEMLNGKIMNLHPSYLPLGRGNDPIPWGIIEGEVQGVSIHFVNNQIDEGPIIVKKLIDHDMSSNAGQIYEIAMKELFHLFKEIIADWIANKTTSQSQFGKSSYHLSQDLENIRHKLRTSDNFEIEKVVRMINALHFMDGRRAEVLLSDGNIWKIELVMEKITNGSVN